MERIHSFIVMGSLKSAAIFDHFHTSFAWNSLHTNWLKLILKSTLSYLYTMYILEPIWCKYSIGISFRIFWISVFEHGSCATKSICIVSRPMFCVNCVISLHVSRLVFFSVFRTFFVRFEKRWNDTGYGKKQMKRPRPQRTVKKEKLRKRICNTHLHGER